MTEQKVNLPKLKKIGDNVKKKPCILLLADDIRLFSGISCVSKEIVLGTVHKYRWVELGSAINNPDMGKILDLSAEVAKETGVTDANVKLYPFSGYGNQEVLRELINREQPDAILHYTDPRFWEWLYQMEHEVRQSIPIYYYAVWDCPPPPLWNKPFYESCDLIMNISKQSHALTRAVMGEDITVDLEKDEGVTKGHGKTLLSYIPHGINEKYFHPITDESEKIKAKETVTKVWGDTSKYDFILFYNNRNIRRKMTADIIYAYRLFCDELLPEKAKRCLLALHTAPMDEAGTNLLAVVNTLCQDHNVIFSKDKVSTTELNHLYNRVDVTIMASSNEGFGLGTAESLMAGTPIIVNVTGGLQDQCGFKNEKGEYLTVNDYSEEWPSNHDGKYRNHGDWAKVVWPSNRSIQGSIPTPYIADDRCRFEDIAIKIREWYDTPQQERKKRGLNGREYLLRPETGMSASEMCNRFIEDMDFALENWTPKKRFKLYKAEKIKVKKTKLTKTTFTENKFI